MSSNAARVCEYCGKSHPNQVCHLIKSIEYHQNGAVKRIEFWGQEQSVWTMPMPTVFGNPPGIS